jgi:2-polyprenyl-3-methyl-5-hydroxy-6-metoxy-1,4-benzoquinol methylase
MTSKPCLIDNTEPFKNCPLCNSKNVTLKGRIKYSQPILFSTSTIEMTSDPELWSCLDCDSGFSKNVISEKDATFLYQQGSSGTRWRSDSFEVDKTSEVVEAVSPLLKNGTKVLDIGCSAGDFLDFAKTRQCLTYGLEFSQSNLDLLKEKGHTAYSDMQEINECYDVITAFDVIEHLYDVNRFINFCADHLTEDGCLVIVTGDISSMSARLAKSKWLYVSYPEHIVFPSIKYFESHPRLANIKLTHTFANSRSKKWLSQFKGLVKSIMTGFSPSTFMGCDHILVIANPRPLDR